jgi:glycosyltransferase involved in cell wall biosynthesis
MKNKKILIHSLVFSPDGVSTAYLYNDIALGFQQSGYEVVVLTTTPHYNRVPEDMIAQPMKKQWAGLYYKSNFKGIPVYHVPQKKYRSFLARVIGFVYWHLVSLLLGLFQKNICLVLSPSPPLTIGLISILLGRLKGAKVVYNVQEIYPDFLINQGNLRSGILIRILKRLETTVYRYADAVTTIDEIFYKTIVDRFAEKKKLTVIPNFVDTDIYQPLGERAYSLDQELFPDRDTLKLMYAGNIGHAQDWEPLLWIARKFRGAPIGFWVIGEGVLKEQLREVISKEGLTNIHLLPYQARNGMASVIAYADLHFIFMNPQMEGQGFPSKVYTIMACGKPLLVLSGEHTPITHFLKDKNSAFLITHQDQETRMDTLGKLIQQLLLDRSELKSMGENGCILIEEQFSKKAVVTQYVSLAERLINENRHG